MTVSTVIHRNMSTMQRTTIMISNYRCRSVCCYTNRSTHYTGCDTVTAIVSVLGWRQNLNSCRVLVSSSWFVGVDFCSESSMVSYIVYLPMDAPAVCETVASLDAVSTISGLFTMLFAVVILDAVAKSVRLGVMMYLLEKKYNFKYDAHKLEARLVTNKAFILLKISLYGQKSPDTFTFGPFVKYISKY